nr:RecE family exodeoxyribonuclease [Salmonella enterica]
MPLRHRVLAQHIGEGEYLYHVDASQKKRNSTSRNGHR